jgi:chorismate--pyruvate lyase
LKHYDASTAAPLLPLDLWLSGPELLRGVPAGLAAWLTDAGLLTERIREAAGAAPSVRVVEERLGFLTGEQQALLEAPAASCFVRQVELCGAGRPWVFAESLIPDHTLELHPWLAELGDSSLGATLAAIPGVSRGPFEFAPEHGVRHREPGGDRARDARRPRCHARRLRAPRAPAPSGRHLAAVVAGDVGTVARRARPSARAHLHRVRARRRADPLGRLRGQ